ncbi:MAG TPA: DUF456 domain-containing protein [Candidatus Hydrogenedentes bacterium]|nr:DUF456 domain-containing protein [Candidatus Hydrogenedentota bacterium]
MALFLAIVGWALFLIAVLTGIVLDLMGLFGNWVILGAAAIAWIVTGFEHFGFLALGVMSALALLGELIESGAAGLGASQCGGSRGSIIAALIGCVAGAAVGTPLFPVVGTVAGACLGAFIGAALHEYLNMERTAGQSMRVGAGAAMGRLFGLLAKTLVGFIMLLVAALSY